MTTYYWVGGGSGNTWAATANTNWSLSSGGANNAGPPTTGDSVIFDSNSGTSNSVIAASISLASIDCTGGTGSYAGTLTHNTGVTLTISTAGAAALRFSTGMTYTPASVTALVTFSNTSGTAAITCGGQKFWAILISGVGGTMQQQDALLVNAGTGAILTVTSGIFDCNGFATTATIMSSAGALARSLLLGTIFTVGGNAANATSVWNTVTTTNLTFTKNSCNIVVLPQSFAGPVYLHVFAGGGLTFNTVTVNPTSTQTIFQITGANTFGHLIIGSGWSIALPGNSTTTISNPFTWAGTPALPMFIFNGALNVLSTISCPSGACTLTWGGLINTPATTTGTATFTAINSFNCGWSAGWSNTPPADETVSLSANTVAVLNNTTGTVASGTVAAASSTTSLPTSAFTMDGTAASGVVANQFVGRVVIFDGNTTTAGLQGTAVVISASSASNTPTLTVAALPASPASGDTFSVI